MELAAPSRCHRPRTRPPELDGYTMTKSSLHFPVDRPLPKALVKKLIAVRLADASRRSR